MTHAATKALRDALVATAANLSTIDLQRVRLIDDDAFAVQSSELVWYRVTVQRMEPKSRQPRRTKASMQPRRDEEEP